MRESAFYKYVTVEASHFRNSEDTNTTKGSGRYIQDFTFCDVGNQFSIGIALQTIEGNIGCCNITLQSTS